MFNVIKKSYFKIFIMKKHLSILLILVCPLFVFSQLVEVDGKLKITEMDTVNAENQLVVKQTDGTLATRMLSSLPQSQDTTRTWKSDLLLTTAICTCPTLPPTIIHSLLDNGYSLQDLVEFNISTLDLLASGISIQDLLTAGVSIQDLILSGATIQNLLLAGISIQDLITAGVSIQELLDVNQTPLALFNSGVLLDSLYGKTFEGGLIFYLNTSTGEGLVAAPSDQGAFYEWGCINNAITGADGIVIGTGSQNTTDIINGCPTSDIAAKICEELNLNDKMDWFLPSKDELNLMWENLADSDGNGDNYGPTDPGNLGGFLVEFYWSSSEFDSEKAWFQYFSNGQLVNGTKSTYFHIRAARFF